MSTEVVHIPHTQSLLPITKEKRTRCHTAYTVHDIKSETLLLTQKLQNAVDFIHRHLASAQREHVSVQSLYEAADTCGNRVEGCHKMRYKISKLNLHQAHAAFNQKRQTHALRAAIITTQNPQCYPTTTVPPLSNDEK